MNKDTLKEVIKKIIKEVLSEGRKIGYVANRQPGSQTSRNYYRGNRDKNQQAFLFSSFKDNRLALQSAIAWAGTSGEVYELKPDGKQGERVFPS
jgi:hypothetical protein